MTQWQSFMLFIMGREQRWGNVSREPTLGSTQQSDWHRFESDGCSRDALACLMQSLLQSWGLPSSIQHLSNLPFCQPHVGCDAVALDAPADGAVAAKPRVAAQARTDLGNAEPPRWL